MTANCRQPEIPHGPPNGGLVAPTNACKAHAPARGPTLGPSLPIGSAHFRSPCRYILVYPQGCDVANHLSLFLCVADYDKLLPGEERRFEVGG